jgi:hypothetical protein
MDEPKLKSEWFEREDHLGGVYQQGNGESLSIVINGFQATLRLHPKELKEDERFYIERPLWEGFDLWYDIYPLGEDMRIRVKVAPMTEKTGISICRMEGNKILYSICPEYHFIRQICQYLFTGFPT